MPWPDIREPLHPAASNSQVSSDFNRRSFSPTFIFLFSCRKRSGICHSQAMVWWFYAIIEDLNPSIFLFCHLLHAAFIFMVTRRLLLLQPS